MITRTSDIDGAISRATSFCAGIGEPDALVWLARIAQEFRIEALNGSLARFDRLVDRDSAQAPLRRLFRRIADPASALCFDDLDAITHTSDRIVVAALYCDQLDLPPHYPRVLGEAVDAGGYWSTHALLAWIWLRKHHHPVALSDELVESLFARNTDIVNENPRVVTDLKLEAAAFLFEAGEGARIDTAFIDCVLKTQNKDGGWGMTRANPGVSDWHGSVLGLLLLLHVRRAASRRMPPAS